MGGPIDPFQDVEWRLVERDAVIERATCADTYEESCGPDHLWSIASRPALQVSGAAAPWFVYWLSSDDTDLDADASARPLAKGSAWMLEATLRYPAPELCVRLSALNVLTDEQEAIERCAVIDPSTSFESPMWRAGSIKECGDVPAVSCTETGSAPCNLAAEALAAAWCGTSIDRCHADHGGIDAGLCDDAAEQCAPYWVDRSDAGIDAGDDASSDAGVDPGSEGDKEAGGRVVHRSPQRTGGWQWASAIAIGLALIRVRQQRTH